MILSSIPKNTPWAKASIRLMGRISKHGWQKAMEMEMDDPYLPDDSDWCRTVVAFAAGESPPKPQHYDPAYEFGETFRCLKCHDRAFVLSDRTVQGDEVIFGGFCSCDLGIKTREEHRKSDEERQSKSDRRRSRSRYGMAPITEPLPAAVPDDDLPF